MQEKNYIARDVEIVLPDDTTMMCRTYQIVMETTGECIPDPYYKRILVCGAKQNGIPEDYVRYLENIKDNGNMTVPEGFKRVLEVVREMSGEDATKFIEF